LKGIVAEMDAKQKKDGKLNPQDSWLRVQAAIRVLQTHLKMKNYNELLYESDELTTRYRGTVEELIAWSLVFHAFREKHDQQKQFQTRDKMKVIFDQLPASAFTASSGEYSREYWEKIWFAPQK
jgi:hypothetical protein